MQCVNSILIAFHIAHGTSSVSFQHVPLRENSEEKEILKENLKEILNCTFTYLIFDDCRFWFIYLSIDLFFFPCARVAGIRCYRRFADYFIFKGEGEGGSGKYEKEIPAQLLQKK